MHLLKKILILSAEKTGHGHKSIAEALSEQKDYLKLPVEICAVDSFALGGRVMEMFGNMYNGVAVYAPHIWNAIYVSSNIGPGFINHIISFMIRKNLKEAIDGYRPDIILSLHASFVGSVIDALESERIRIPVIPLIADFDNVTHMWADSRSLYTLCPTENAKKTIMKLGIPEDRIRVFGFPARKRFTNPDPEQDRSRYDRLSEGSERIRFLIMNGSQGNDSSLKMAKVLLRNVNCTVTVIAGNGKGLKPFLEARLNPEFGDRVRGLGFVENVEYYMHNSDILILRASPNVVTEAVNSCRPIIVTGSLMGQEARNPQFVRDNNLGIVCRDIDLLPKAVDELLSDNCRKLREIRSSQMKFRNPDASRDIIRFIYGCLDRRQ